MLLPIKQSSPGPPPLPIKVSAELSDRENVPVAGSQKFQNEQKNVKSSSSRLKSVILRFSEIGYRDNLLADDSCDDVSDDSCDDVSDDSCDDDSDASI